LNATKTANGYTISGTYITHHVEQGNYWRVFVTNCKDGSGITAWSGDSPVAAAEIAMTGNITNDAAEFSISIGNALSDGFGGDPIGSQLTFTFQGKHVDNGVKLDTSGAEPSTNGQQKGSSSIHLPRWVWYVIAIVIALLIILVLFYCCCRPILRRKKAARAAPAFTGTSNQVYPMYPQYQAPQQYQKDNSRVYVDAGSNMR
jgi:hypothetical protein